jgi:hypothetical protein
MDSFLLLPVAAEVDRGVETDIQTNTRRCYVARCYVTVLDVTPTPFPGLYHMLRAVAPSRGLHTTNFMICLVAVVAVVVGRLLHFVVRVAEIVTRHH